MKENANLHAAACGNSSSTINFPYNQYTGYPYSSAPVTANSHECVQIGLNSHYTNLNCQDYPSATFANTKTLGGSGDWRNDYFNAVYLTGFQHQFSSPTHATGFLSYPNVMVNSNRGRNCVRFNHGSMINQIGHDGVSRSNERKKWTNPRKRAFNSVKLNATYNHTHDKRRGKKARGSNSSDSDSTHTNSSYTRKNALGLTPYSPSSCVTETKQSARLPKACSNFTNSSNNGTHLKDNDVTGPLPAINASLATMLNSSTEALQQWINERKKRFPRTGRDDCNDSSLHDVSTVTLSYSTSTHDFPLSEKQQDKEICAQDQRENLPSSKIKSTQPRKMPFVKLSRDDKSVIEERKSLSVMLHERQDDENMLRLLNFIKILGDNGILLTKLESQGALNLNDILLPWGETSV